MSYNKDTGMYEGFIYLITNKVNGKQYVGQTTQTVSSRFRSHKERAKKPKQYIHNAMHIYGIDNFEIKQIEKETALSLEELCESLDKLEMYYIKKFNTLNPNGYNNTIGGRENDGFRELDRRVLQYSLNGCLLHSYKSLKNASDVTGFDNIGISKCCLGNTNSSFGYVWRYEDTPLETNAYKNDFIENGEGVSICGSHIVKKVKKYDLDGNLLAVYNSALEVEKESNGYFRRPTIQACCSGHCYKYKGFVWRYYNDDFNKYKPMRKPKTKTVKQKNDKKPKPLKNKTVKKPKLTINMRTIPIDKYNSSLEYICTYDNVRSIPNLTKKQISSIILCCQGKQIMSQGYIWRFHGDCVDKYKTSKDTWNEIAMLDKNSLIVKVFKNAQLAAEYINGDRSCIIECCRGLTNRKTHKGYYWKYYNDIKSA